MIHKDQIYLVAIRELDSVAGDNNSVREARLVERASVIRHDLFLWKLEEINAEFLTNIEKS